ncbi:MAG: SAM-dependent chlorinase/fluorinase, partial [Rubrobacteraceae bacterium]
DLDRYGNARLSVLAEELSLEYGAPLEVDCGDGEMPVRYCATFGDAHAGELTNERYLKHPVSSTFHGRDIFAPVAAYLAAETEMLELGPQIDPGSLVPLALAGVEPGSDATYEARILDLDRYGNARLSVLAEELSLEYGAPLEVDCGDGEMPVRYCATFGDANAGELVLVTDSHWRLSLAINKGNAAQALALRRGGKVVLRIGD